MVDCHDKHWFEYPQLTRTPYKHSKPNADSPQVEAYEQKIAEMEMLAAVVQKRGADETARQGALLQEWNEKTAKRMIQVQPGDAGDETETKLEKWKSMFCSFYCVSLLSSCIPVTPARMLVRKPRRAVAWPDRTSGPSGQTVRLPPRVATSSLCRAAAYGREKVDLRFDLM